jgi:hypothetical protein
MIIPISLQEYMSIIARKFQNLPEGEEKENLWLEIKKIADRQYPTVIVEDISNNQETNSEKE